MKIKKLLLTALCAVLSVGAWADDIQELKALGWTQVTELTDVESNYYVFVDAGSGLYSIGRGLAAGDRPMSHVLGNPTVDNRQVWILEGSGTTFKMKNLKDNYYFNSGNAGWNDSMNASNGTDFTFTLNGGKYDISASTGYVGPWNNDNKVTLADAAENIAVNKAANQAPGYYIFAMSRTNYDAARFGKDQLEAQGWTLATNIDDAVGDDKYVIFLEAKSGVLVISRNESGRPAYKSLGNPLYNKHELWSIKKDGSVYGLNSEASNQYLNDQGWNTGFGAYGDGSKRKFVSLGENKYAIQNNSNNDWIGRWQNSDAAPYEMENIAANKSEAQRGNYYVYYMSKNDYNAKRAAAITTATATSPADLTDFIYNPRFSDLERWGWKEGGTSENRQFANNAAECWKNNNMTFTQTLTGLPNGKYTISVQAVNPDNGSSTGAKLVGNTTEKAIEATHSSNNYGVVAAALMNDEELGKTSLDVMVTDGTLEYGIKAPTGWVIFDNFKLTYQGEDISDYEVAYNAANTAAKAIDQEKPMFGEYKTALQNAISTYGDKTYTTVATIREAITALETATTNANNSIQQYVDNAAALAAQKALIDGTNVYAAGWTTGYVATYNTKKDAYDNRTLNEALVNPTAATGHRASTAYNDLLTPWTIGGEACNNFDKSLYINTWSTEANNKENGSGMFTPFFEYWVADANSLGANDIATTVTGLANGYYKIDILTRFRIKNNGGDVAKGITLSLNDNEDGQAYSEQGATCDDGEQFRYATLTAAAQVTDGSLKINFNVAEGNNISWLAFRNVMYSSTDKEGYDAIVEAANNPDLIATLKSELKSKLDGFDVPTANIGDDAFQYAQTEIDRVSEIAGAAQGVYDEEDATSSQVYAQILAMKKLIPVINAPAVGKKFHIVLNNNNGWSHDNKAMTYLANDRADAGKYNIQYKAEVNANYAQAFTMTNVEGNKYKMSQLDNDGTERYISTGVTYGGNTSQIRTTTDAEEALVVEVIATANEGVYNLKNTEANQYIGSQDAGVYTVNSHINFNIVEAEKATANLKITAGKYGTFIAPFDANKPEGVTLYSCAAVEDNVLTLETADEIKANTPYIVYSETDVNENLSDWGLAIKDTYTTGLLTGMYANAVKIPVGSYVLQVLNDHQAFYKVAEGKDTFSGTANRCYLTDTESNSARLDIVIEGETGINDLGTENGSIADGKYMQNNKVVIVKNGRKYNVTGQMVK